MLASLLERRSVVSQASFFFLSVSRFDVSSSVSPGSSPLNTNPSLLNTRQDSLPLSPNLGRDQLAPLSPTESPLPSLQEKEEEAVAGPSNSSQESWSPDSDQAKQGRKEHYFYPLRVFPSFCEDCTLSEGSTSETDKYVVKRSVTRYLY